MFRDTVNLIDPIPDSYVRSLNRLDNEPDYSLTCLGIAMLKPRIADYKGVAGVYYSFSSIRRCISDLETHLGHMDTECPNLLYYRYTSEGDIETAKTRLTELGFTITEKISALIKQKSNIESVLASKEDENCAVVFIKSSDMRFYHMIIAFISILFPWYFREYPVNDDEKLIVQTLNKTSKDDFVVKLQEILKPMAAEFRMLTLRNILKGLHQQKIRHANDELNAARENVRAYEQELRIREQTAHDCLVRLEGLKATEQYDQAEQEFVDYIATDERIYDMKVDGNTLSFNVASLITAYDADAWRSYAERTGEGTVLDGKYGSTLREVFKTRQNRAKLLNNIFSESPTIAVKTSGHFYINFETNDGQATRHYRFDNGDSPIFRDRLCNPHLYNFGCMGTRRSETIRQELRNRNYIGAFAAMSASVENVNMSEVSQNLRPFLGWILSSDKKIIRNLETGEDMTPEEALVYLVDKEKKSK